MTARKGISRTVHQLPTKQDLAENQEASKWPVNWGYAVEAMGLEPTTS